MARAAHRGRGLAEASGDVVTNHDAPPERWLERGAKCRGTSLSESRAAREFLQTSPPYVCAHADAGRAEAMRETSPARRLRRASRASGLGFRQPSVCA